MEKEFVISLVAGNVFCLNQTKIIIHNDFLNEKSIKFSLVENNENLINNLKEWYFFGINRYGYGDNHNQTFLLKNSNNEYVIEKTIINKIDYGNIIYFHLNYKKITI